MQIASSGAIAERIKAARAAGGLTQQKLANDAGLAIRTLARIEAGEGCTVDTLQRIAHAAGIDVADLLAPEPTEATA